MRLREIVEPELHEVSEIEEGWKSTAAAAAIGAAGMWGAMNYTPQTTQPVPDKPVASVQHVMPAAQTSGLETYQIKKGDSVYGIGRRFRVNPQDIIKLNNLNNNGDIQIGQEIYLPKDAITAPPEIKNLTGTKREAVLLQTAMDAGLQGEELAAFMAQCYHETMGFKSLKEFGGSLDFRKYDPKYAPKKAKALGNKYKGDGARYKGRGFIQLTGRYNYKKAGKELGLPLEKNPELVEKPEIAAKVAVWFWKHRVQPNVDNFKNTREVTKQVNPGLRGLKDRHEQYNDYMTLASFAR
jgi:predicted chitinase